MNINFKTTKFPVTLKVSSTSVMIPLQFFGEVIPISKKIQFKLGYFSSTSISTLSYGFAQFIYNGGTIDFLINHFVSENDYKLINDEFVLDSDFYNNIQQDILNDIERLNDVLTKKQVNHFYNCLRYLIDHNRISFIPVTTKSGEISHYKEALFWDNEDNVINIIGSCNFTYKGIVCNGESFSIKRSWGEESEKANIVNEIKDYEKIFKKESKDFIYLNPEKLINIINQKSITLDEKQLLDEELDLVDLKSVAYTEEEHKIKKVNNALKEKFNDTVLKIVNEPRFPQGHNPFPYQLKALENWKDAGMVGFFEMATGTGKTITALNCALELYREENKIKILILVPSISLADQWAEEVSSFNFKNIIIANSKHNTWAEDVVAVINKSQLLDNSFVIVTTFATFAMDKFQSVINRLNDDVLFIADEAHNFGTKRMIQLYPTKFKRRIGLSATPKRHFDDEGTSAILAFFNAIEKPTFKLDMAEAIEKGFLCEYFYFPKTVTLTKDELDEYKEISKKLLKYFDPGTNRFADNTIVSMLLQQRKRIVHKAANKKNCLRECLREIVAAQGEIKYTLVYVPEGVDHSVDELDRKLIDEYSHIVSNEFKANQHQFIGGTENRSDILKRFAEGRLQVLTAMKCLDEGVDVKRTETAIFCSSTGNPRQFIQRRGRILRLHKDKKNATIYDMIVIPDISDIRGDANIAMEKSILNAELRRVYEFASLAKNKYQALLKLQDIAEQFDIDIFSNEIS